MTQNFLNNEVIETDQNALLDHFKKNRVFAKWSQHWDQTTVELFVRLANAVRKLRLDWWFTEARTIRLRFGRKEKGSINGKPIGGLSIRKKGIAVRWAAFADLNEMAPTPINEALVCLIEASASKNPEWANLAEMQTDRPGYWPDEFDNIEAASAGDLDDDADVEDEDEDEDEDEPGLVAPAMPLEAAYNVATPPKNEIYYGPPGTGKTYQLQELLRNEYPDKDGIKRSEFVTFHQSYGYEEFIEGLRPVLAKNQKTDPPLPEDGKVHYENVPGAFLRLCERARKDKSHKYVMFIDEINRGNISKIFGELITLLEIDKRDGRKNKLEITLPYSQEPFSVPWNVDVIGSMNTADRSLAMIDTALRRRFEFKEVMPDPNKLIDVLVESGGVQIDIRRMLETINDRIEALYDREHTIGHAYFMALKNDPLPADPFGTLKNIFKNRIIPLLEEYFFDDWHKIRLVLADNQKESQPERQFIKESAKHKELHALFGKDDALDQYQLPTRYQRNEAALSEPLAYVGIYDPEAAKTK